jgi:hypothetical protein
MKFKLQLTKDALFARWAWTGVGAILVFLVLQLLDGLLQARTGFGTLNLQSAATGADVRFIMDRWQSPADAALAGFLLGGDFLFIPLYGAALYFGAIAARETFAPRPCGKRRLLDALTVAPLVAVAADVCENTLEFAMLLNGPTNTLAGLAFNAAVLKFAAFVIGLVLSATTLLALAARRKAAGKKE